MKCLLLALPLAFATYSAADTSAATINGPTAIGFFPPFTQQELDDDDGSITEGTSHVSAALEDLAECLAPTKLETRLELTHSLVVIDGGASHKLSFPDEDGKAVGIVLAAPGKAPLVVYASAGPSSLLWLAPEAAAAYFSAPKCKREVS